MPKVRKIEQVSAISVSDHQAKKLKSDEYEKVEVGQLNSIPQCTISEEIEVEHDCMICYDSIRNYVKIHSKEVDHSGCIYCKECLNKYVKLKVVEDKWTQISCPTKGCKHSCDLVLPEIFEGQELEDFLEKLTDNAINFNPNYKKCPNPDCNFAIEMDGCTDQFPECGRCYSKWCIECNGKAHEGFECEQAKSDDDKMLELALKKDTKPCPHCKATIQKSGGCSHIICKCGNQFCYDCLAPWTADHMKTRHPGNNLTQLMLQQPEVIRDLMAKQTTFIKKTEARKNEENRSLNIIKKIERDIAEATDRLVALQRQLEVVEGRRQETIFSRIVREIIIVIKMKDKLKKLMKDSGLLFPIPAEYVNEDGKVEEGKVPNPPITEETRKKYILCKKGMDKIKEAGKAINQEGLKLVMTAASALNARLKQQNDQGQYTLEDVMSILSSIKDSRHQFILTKQPPISITFQRVLAVADENTDNPILNAKLVLQSKVDVPEKLPPPFKMEEVALLEDNFSFIPVSFREPSEFLQQVAISII
eukprot:TRINITY_DN13754_c0_g1_i1.p1 TRINITY_DN13754_c0_g1~~TRINITY_DN13754_c0_g1_i1.p1  ORF type:complete len:533 (-),score=158.03 TRINITY_DN13754_c0_g1_i1:49-1647(-)